MSRPKRGDRVYVHILNIFIKTLPNHCLFITNQFLSIPFPTHLSSAHIKLRQVSLDKIWMWFLYKTDLRISAAETNWRNYQNQALFKLKNLDIFHII